MNQPFIRNHQYNLIKEQAAQLQKACNTVSDPRVVESVRYSAQLTVSEVFPEATLQQKKLLEQLGTLKTEPDIKTYVGSLEPFLLPFVPVTEQQLKKLFPKNKKLKVPDVAAIDFRYISYLGWTDIATSKMFLAYWLDEQLVGIEGRFTPVQKKSTCFLCKRQAEVALFTAVTKWKPANASPDYYKAIGNYMCVNSAECNRHITDVSVLETFIHDVLKRN